MELYDLNHDGRIDSEELKSTHSPLRAAKWKRDGSIVFAEIASRVSKWKSATTLIMVVSPTFYFQGKPLAGATITFEPAEFLGSSYKSMSATTDANGVAHFTGDDRHYPGIYLGLYKVRVSKCVKDQEVIPAKYNSDTVLVHEVAANNWGGSSLPFFDLHKD
jgi:hypothetical protein